MREQLKLSKKPIVDTILQLKKKGCGKRLAIGQYFSRCGEFTEGQDKPVLCIECGGKLRLKETK